MSIWHDDKVFPEDKRYWLAFINVRCNGNKFWTVSHHLADFIDDVSGAGFKVCNTKIEKWCYLDDLLAQQSEIDRLKKALKFYAKGRNYKKYLVSLPTGISGMNHIKCFVTLKDRGEIAQKALNNESEE